jgi:ABC-type antimicrobial peptide transport system permease subunit
VRLIQDFNQDVRYGVRIIARTPGFSVVIVLILAIGIGSGTASYSLIDACLLHSKTYPVVDRWDVVHAYSPQQKMFINYMSVPEVLEVKRLTDIFEAVGAIRGDSFNLTGGDYPERILGTHVTANGISMTRVAPILGRSFTEEEDRPGGPPVVVLSAELWKRRFASDPKILGQVIRLDGVAYTVLGVMPPHYDLWGGELWIPLQLNPADSNRSDRQSWIITVLRKGVTEAAANARLAVLAKQLGQQFGRRDAYTGAATPDTPLEIVGVVSDVRQTRTLEEAPLPEFYLPLDQQESAPRIMAVIVRSTSDPAQLTTAVRKAVASVDSEQPIYDVGTMDEVVADSFGPKRLTLFLLVFLGSIALLLSTVGLYALVAYSVSHRRHEIGIRLAIGAQPGQIRRLVLLQGVRLAALGVTAGLAGALAATRLMKGLVYGVSASDPLTLLCVAAALFGTALLACYFPAQSAVRVDPITVLRNE